MSTTKSDVSVVMLRCDRNLQLMVTQHLCQDQVVKGDRSARYVDVRIHLSTDIFNDRVDFVIRTRANKTSRVLADVEYIYAPIITHSVTGRSRVDYVHVVLGTGSCITLKVDQGGVGLALFLNKHSGG